MDNLLSGLFGGHEDGDKEARAKRENDFVKRVEEGNPAEDVPTEEVVANYKHVASQLPDSEYVNAARDALAKFSPEQRREFGQLISMQTDINIQGDVDSPDEIAQVTNQLRSTGGGGLAGLLSGTGGDDLMESISGLIGGGGGSAQKHENAGMADLLGNPIVKSILAAIAAMAMKKYAGGEAGGAFGGALSGVFGEDKGTEVPAEGGTFRLKDDGSVVRDKQDDDGSILDTLFGGGAKNKDSKADEMPSGAGDLPKQGDKPQSL